MKILRILDGYIDSMSVAELEADLGEWKPMEEGDEDSSSSEAVTPYAGYVALEEEKGEEEAGDLEAHNGE